MRIVFLGTPEFAVYPLQYLVEQSEHEVVGVVSQPSKKKGRGQKLLASPVTEYAIKKGLIHFEPLKASNSEFLQSLRDLEPDLFITCAYGKILTQKFLNIPKRGTINIHPSELPKYRGAIPVPAALLDGLKKTYISILFTVKALDAGNIIVQTPSNIGPKERSDELLHRLFKESIEPLKEALTKLEDPHFEGTPQNEEQATECRKIEKEDGLVDWTLSAETLFNRFRAFSPWPGTYTFFKGKRIVITGMDFDAKETCDNLSHTGQFTLESKSKSLKVVTSSGVITLVKIKPEGKKEMLAADLWNQIPKAERLSAIFSQGDK